MGLIYRVAVVYEGVPEIPGVERKYGPITSKDTAEQCLIAVASRQDVKSAIIESEEA